MIGWSCPIWLWHCGSMLWSRERNNAKKECVCGQDWQHSSRLVWCDGTSDQIHSWMLRTANGYIHVRSKSCVWTTQIEKPGLTRVPKLASLTPTTEAFTENVKRAHLQTFLWKNALQLTIGGHKLGMDERTDHYGQQQYLQTYFPSSQ